MQAIEGVTSNVAALAAKYANPLSARLLPVSGMGVGELAKFESPYLIDAKVMSLG